MQLKQHQVQFQMQQFWQQLWGGKYKLHLIFFFGTDERQQHNQRLFELIFYHLC
jgi:hypothetical protein